VTYATSGQYDVSLTVDGPCGPDTETKTLYITVNSTPDCTITTPSNVCENSTGNTASVPDAGAGAIYDWSITGNGIITSTPPYTNSINWDATSAGTATINITITDANGCKCTNGGQAVTVNSTPDCTITAPSSVCAGSTGNTASVPDAGAGATYTWNVSGNGTLTGGQGTNSITWGATAAGSNATIDITITDGNGCTCSNTVPVSVRRCGGGGGGGSGPIISAACPITLTGNMLGTVAHATMCEDGTLCETLLCTADGHLLRIEEGTKVMLADNIVPRLIKFSRASATPPTPDNITLVSPVYELLAYASLYGGKPSPITVSPAGLLIINYPANGLPENTSEVFIGYYDAEMGWRATEGGGGPAEIGKARGQVSHFTPFAVLAKTTEQASPAEFKTSNLITSPSQAQLNQEVSISINVANTGGTSGNYNLDLKVNGISKLTKQVTIAAGTSQTVSFTITGDAVGRHQVEVAGLSGEFEIAQQSQINWWLIGGITGAILLLASIGLITWRRRLRSRKSP
jgi:PKD repeat protein